MLDAHCNAIYRAVLLAAPGALEIYISLSKKYRIDLSVVPGVWCLPSSLQL